MKKRDAAAGAAVMTTAFDPWAIGGDDGTDIPDVVTQYAIEPDRGCDARNHSDDIVTQIEDLPNFRDSARIIRRTITYGLWEYVPAGDLL